MTTKYTFGHSTFGSGNFGRELVPKVGNTQEAQVTTDVNISVTADYQFTAWELRVQSAGDSRAARLDSVLVKTATVAATSSTTIPANVTEIQSAGVGSGFRMFGVYLRDAAGNWSDPEPHLVPSRALLPANNLAPS